MGQPYRKLYYSTGTSFIEESPSQLYSTVNSNSSGLTMTTVYSTAYHKHTHHCHMF
ncbi:hypothetical protein I79_005625 [Cricetulus griseus]|uniref:Uncharacterized protein n=1 Tax=Cricetulus griseus TaxID=10029 RepID=G3H5P1_CRIGR|nr:hypothetical protein I79_005625 [Cricetulus griseus]